MRLRFGRTWCIGVIVALVGCGGEDPNVPPETLVPVTGTVKLDGQAVGGVSLTFTPDYDTKGTGGYAVTAADGTYTVKHQTGVDGIEPGRYKVLFSRMLKPDGSPVPTGESAMDHNAAESMPAKYRDLEQTPVRPEVKAGMGPFDIEIQSK